MPSADQTLRAVILDVDGTLVDSNDAHAQAWVQALAEAGRAVTFEAVRPLIGMGADKLLPRVAGLSDGSGKGKRVSDRRRDLGKAIAERRGEIFREKYLPHLRPFPGTRALLLRMRDDGLRLAVASSATEEELSGLLRVAQVQDLLAAATSSDDAERSKPDPDIIRAALRRVGEPPPRAVMIGDTPYDVEAATRSGLRTIAFRCGGWNDDKLRGAAEIYDGAEDLLRRYESSLIGRARGAFTRA